MKKFFKQVKLDLKQTGYVASDELVAKICLFLKQAVGTRAMILDGPPGTGKTALAKAVAKIIQAKMYFLACTPGTTPEDILTDVNIVRILRGASGDISAVKNDADVVKLGWLPTIFLASQKGPVVGLADEIDKTDPKVDSLFLSALEEGKIFVEGYGWIHANRENLIIFFTKNDERFISEPLMRRCRREYMKWISPTLEMDILMGTINKAEEISTVSLPTRQQVKLPASIAEVLVILAGKLRDRQEDLIKPPATQELMMCGQDLMVLSAMGQEQYASEIAIGWLAAYQEDKEVLSSIVTRDKLQNLLLGALAKAKLQDKEIENKLSIDDDFVKF